MKKFIDCLCVVITCVLLSPLIIVISPILLVLYVLYRGINTISPETGRYLSHSPYQTLYAEKPVRKVK